MHKLWPHPCTSNTKVVQPRVTTNDTNSRIDHPKKCGEHMRIRFITHTISNPLIEPNRPNTSTSRANQHSKSLIIKHNALDIYGAKELSVNHTNTNIDVHCLFIPYFG